MVQTLEERPGKGGDKEQSEGGVVEGGHRAAVLEGRLEGPVLRQVDRQQGEQRQHRPEDDAHSLKRTKKMLFISSKQNSAR